MKSRTKVNFKPSVKYENRNQLNIENEMKLINKELRCFEIERWFPYPRPWKAHLTAPSAPFGLSVDLSRRWFETVQGPATTVITALRPNSQCPPRIYAKDSTLSSRIALLLFLTNLQLFGNVTLSEQYSQLRSYSLIWFSSTKCTNFYTEEFEEHLLAYEPEFRGGLWLWLGRNSVQMNI